jgi:hypothetical protein
LASHGSSVPEAKGPPSSGIPSDTTGQGWSSVGQPDANASGDAKGLAKLTSRLASLQIDNESLADVDGEGEVALSQPERLPAQADQAAEAAG